MHPLLFIKSRFWQSDWIRGCLTLCFLVGATSALGASGDYDVLLDVSGSMLGFTKGVSEKGANEGASWRNLLNMIESRKASAFLFGDSLRPAGGALAQAPSGDQRTKLNEALEQWSTSLNAAPLAVVITDNVADDRTPDGASQQAFEELVSDMNRFNHIGAFAVRLPFSGKLYDPVTDHPGKKLYSGPRALVVYLLGRTDSVSQDTFERARDYLRDSIRSVCQANDFQYFQVEPIESIPDGIQVLNGGSRNLRIDTVNGRRTLHILNYHFGDPVDLTLQVMVRNNSHVQLNNVTLNASLDFKDIPGLADPHKTGPINAVVTNPIRTIKVDQAVQFDVHFKIDQRFGFHDINLKTEMGYALRDTQVIQGGLNVDFYADRKAYQMAQADLEQWDYRGKSTDLARSDSSVQSKVYRLGIIIKDLAPRAAEAPKTTLLSLPVNLEAHFGPGPVLVIPFAVVLVGAILFLVVWWLGQGEYFLEDGVGERIPISLGFLQVYRHTSVEGTPQFTLKNVGIGFWMSTRLRRRGGQRLLGAGSRFQLRDEESGEDLSWRLQRQLRSARHHATSDYGSPPWDEGSSGSHQPGRRQKRRGGTNHVEDEWSMS